MRRVWTAFALLGALALAACSGPHAGVSGSASATKASGRLTEPNAVVDFPRTLQADRMVEALVHTTRDADALVTSARLESPLFADSPARDGVVRLFANWTNHVRLRLGTPVCPAPEGASTVVLNLTIDGRAVTETLTADGQDLRKINTEECAEKAVLDVATPSFGKVESQTSTDIHTSIVLTRGASMPDAPVALTSMTGNIVFIVKLDANADATLDPGEASHAVPAIIEVGRCDPHVFAESKKTFVFPVRLAIGDAAPAYVEIQPDPIARAALQALFNSCGDAQRSG